MTIQDVLNECLAWDHSKEHYDLMKESSEIALMEQYISDQVYMLESADEEVFKALTESKYFGESATEENLQKIMEATEEKKKGFWSKVGNGIVKVLKAIGNFFKRIWMWITGKSKKEINFESLEFDDKNLAAIKATLEKYSLLDAIVGTKVAIKIAGSATTDAATRKKISAAVDFVKDSAKFNVKKSKYADAVSLDTMFEDLERDFYLNAKTGGSVADSFNEKPGVNFKQLNTDIAQLKAKKQFDINFNNGADAKAKMDSIDAYLKLVEGMKDNGIISANVLDGEKESAGIKLLNDLSSIVPATISFYTAAMAAYKEIEAFLLKKSK